MSCEESESRWRERLRENGASIVCVSEHSGKVVGFAAAGPSGEEVFGEQGWELYAIYLVQYWQGAGLGRGLFAKVLETDSDGAPVFTWCLSENPSRAFYDSIGGQALGTQSVEIDGVELKETCYGWRDARELRRKLTAEC